MYESHEECLDFVDRTTSRFDSLLGCCRESIRFHSDSTVDSAVSKNLYELAAADEACSTEFLDPDLIKILGSSQGVNNIQVDCLLFDTVDVLEAKLGKTALKRHLTAFKTDLARVA